MARHVVVGSGPAGIHAIETIRRLEPKADITLVADERPYARMALPYFLAREIAAAELVTASEDYLDGLGIERHLEHRAVRLDTTAHALEIDSGKAVRFDNLLIATGSSPVQPPIPGADGKHVHHLWTLADALAVTESAKARRPSAVLVGAGFIGMILLHALHKLGWKLTLVEIEGQILPRMLDRGAASAVEAWLRQRGVEVHTGCTVRAIEGNNRKVVSLSDGRNLSANLVILATGVRPRTELLDGSGIRVEQGVIVDATMQTSVPGIYAAGDVAQGPDLLGGPPAVHAIQPTAVDHGRVAGANMAGHSCNYVGSLAMNILEVAGLHCASFGRWHAAADATVVWNPAQPVYRKLVWSNSRLVGGVLLGPIADTTMLSDVGMLKGLIQSQIDLAEWKSYLQDRPWDLRRAYIASGAASKLLSCTVVGLPTTTRAFRSNDVSPATDPGIYHRMQMGTQPLGFDALSPTPTPGIYKSRDGADKR